MDLTDLQNQPDGSYMEFELPGLLHKVSTSRSTCCNVLYRKLSILVVVEDVVECTHSTNRDIECVHSLK